MPLPIPTGSDPLAQASQLYRQGDFEDALVVLDALIDRHPDLAVAQYLRGIVLKDAGEAAAAAASIDAALELEPELERARYHRGTARFQAGDKHGALSDLEVAVDEEPDFLFAVYNLGVVAASLRRWTTAKAAFARCLDLDPANRTEYVDLLVEIGRSEAQEECYSQAHRIKNRVGVVGDRGRRLLHDLHRAGDAVPEDVVDAATLLSEDLHHVFEDVVRFLRAVDQEPPEVDLIDMVELLERCLFALSPRLRGVRVERRIDEWVPEVMGDRRSLGEVLMNVLTNAIEACNPAVVAALAGGGAPASAPGDRPSREPVITVFMRAVDDLAEIPGIDSVEIEVWDSGPGIDPGALPHVFALGYTTKPFGSGLGLHYSGRVVRAHGGRIDIRNAGGDGGCVVRVLLPASPVGAANLRTLSLRSVLFEDLRPLAMRGPGRR